MILTTERTAWNKTKRIIKYLIVLVVFMIGTSFIDAIISHYLNDPWITFKEDWLVLYGAMAYRLISTWKYK